MLTKQPEIKALRIARSNLLQKALRSTVHHQIFFFFFRILSKGKIK